MNQITVRGIPPEVEKAIISESKRHSFSLNKAIVSLLKKAVGLQEEQKKKKVYHDLDHLFGTWSKEEADQFEESIKDLERIDEDDWK